MCREKGPVVEQREQNIIHAKALDIVHEEAGRTLSREDFDLCLRIAERALVEGV